MTFNEYQELARKTAIYPQVGYNIIYPVLGLAGEAGEVAQILKKLSRDHNLKLGNPDLAAQIPENIEKELIKELGDCLWYISAIVYELADKTLDEVASLNIAKLLDRQKRDELRGSGGER